jgi:hypothetical protein
MRELEREPLPSPMISALAELPPELLPLYEALAERAAAIAGYIGDEVTG